MISVRDFMDPWTFDVRDIHKCCIARSCFPDGREVPFCAYNSLGYREQVTEQLSRSTPSEKRLTRPKPVHGKL